MPDLDPPRHPPSAPEEPARVMVVVDSRPGAKERIQAAADLARQRGVPWLAVSREPIGRFLYSRAEEGALTEHLKLAAELGAEVVHLQPSGLRAAHDHLAFARARGVSTLVVERPARPWWMARFTGSFLEDLLRGAPALQIHVVPWAPQPQRSAFAPPRLREIEPPRLGSAFLFVGVAILAGFLVSRFLDLADIVMVFMLGITIAAARFGRWTAILVSLLSVVSLDFFFVPPRFSLTVTDIRHLGTFGVMLGVGWVVANLAERIRAQARIAQERERYTHALNRLGSVLAEGGSIEAIRTRVEAFLDRELAVPTCLLLTDAAGVLQAPAASPEALGPAEWTAARQCLVPDAPAHPPGEARGFYLPLTGSERPIGVLALFPPQGVAYREVDRDRILPVFATQIAVALERAWLGEERTEARIRARHENLRNTLLSGISHDLRTPLSTIAGAASTLLEPGPEAEPGDQRMLLRSIQQESRRLQRLVDNLLDLSKLESGQVSVRKEWVPMEEVVGSAITRLEEAAGERNVILELPEAWIPVDPVLFEQVLLNVLENAAKFSPPDTPIELRSWIEKDQAAFAIRDHGPGFAESETERVFEKLHRGQASRLASGAGLGLAICRSIIQAHGGTIRASTPPEGGALLSIRIPIDLPPPECLQPPLEPDAP